MELILSVIIAAYVGYRIGWHHREQVAVRRIDNFIKHMEEVPDDRDDFIRIYVEKHEDCLYLYKADNDEFIGQGRTKKEITDILSSKFPGMKIAVDKDSVDYLESLV